MRRSALPAAPRCVRPAPATSARAAAPHPVAADLKSQVAEYADDQHRLGELAGKRGGAYGGGDCRVEVAHASSNAVRRSHRSANVASLEHGIHSAGGTAMRTIMKWIDAIVSKLAHRKVQRDEGNPR